MSGTAVLYALGVFIAAGAVAGTFALRVATRTVSSGRESRPGLPWTRTAYAVTTLLLLAVGAYELLIRSHSFGWSATPAVDFDTYHAATERILAGQSWFLDRQLHGPYDLMLGDVLYPPTAAYSRAILATSRSWHPLQCTYVSRR